MPVARIAAWPMARMKMVMPSEKASVVPAILARKCSTFLGGDLALGGNGSIAWNDSLLAEM